MLNETTPEELERIDKSMEDEKVMRSIEEIQHRLEETELELENVKEWTTSAYKKYNEDKKLWGEADYGEVDAAHEMLSKLTTEVNTLKWVLNKI